jgi:hypothetical protein
VATQRIPGVLGILDDGFPSSLGPWPSGSAAPPLPNGPAASALHPVCTAGLETPAHAGLVGVEYDANGSAVATPEEFEGYTIPDRYRPFEIQGEVVMIRCNPRWLTMARVIAEVGDPEGSQTAEFLHMMRHRPQDSRSAIAGVLIPYFRSWKKDDVADALEQLVRQKNRSQRIVA